MSNINAISLEELDQNAILFNFQEIASELAKDNTSVVVHNEQQEIPIQDPFTGTLLHFDEASRQIDALQSGLDELGGASSITLHTVELLSTDDFFLTGNYSLPSFEDLSQPGHDALSEGNNSTGSDYPSLALGSDFISAEVPIMDTVPLMAIVEGQPVGKSLLDKDAQSVVNRKRLSVSESSAAPSPSGTNSSNGKRPRKKPKLYEQADKSNPKVQRAGYAKSYRDKKKTENERLQKELESAMDELKEANLQLKKYKEESAKQGKLIEKMKTKIEQKEAAIGSLENDLKDEREKNALNPQQTENILRCIHGVVKAACPKDVKAKVKVNVSERLASKRCAAVGKDKMEAIASKDNLCIQSCTFTFDIDKNNTLSACSKID